MAASKDLQLHKEAEIRRTCVLPDLLYPGKATSTRLSFSPEESVIELSASLRAVREQRAGGGGLCGTELNITLLS